MMILAVDVGNSKIVFGTIENGEIGIVASIHTENRYTAEEYGIKINQLLAYYEIDPASFEGAIISSVVPPVTDALKTAVKHLTGIDSMVVGPGMKTGMNVRIDDPSTLAGDLVVGSVAASAFYGTPVIVLDTGTATTMVVVDDKRCYRGGAIMPGVQLGLEALAQGTSLLPDISVTAPKRVIATNTVDSMRSGAVYATASMIDGMTERMEEEMGMPCKVVATGDLSSAIVPYCRRKEIIYDRDLLLKGLWVLYEKNRKTA
ncbi:MAG: type III pantothenate kinase [Oscillospiraceae bacterium]|nr:type III pantothenate kinase [Oscillospiraceae bacterium]